LQLSAPPDRWFSDLLAHYHLQEVQLDAALACAAAALPPIHRDPFDRVIVALARATDSILITSDGRLGEYPGIVVRW
jgi:PIN domain nuclease of toxin-antitoxin system